MQYFCAGVKAQLLLGVDRPRLLKEFFLKLRAHVIGFDRPDCIGDAVRPSFHVELAQRRICSTSISGVMLWEFGAPSNSGVNASGKIQTISIAAPLVSSAVQTHRVGT